MATANRVALVTATPGEIQAKLDELNKEGFRLCSVLSVGSTTGAVLLFFESEEGGRTGRGGSGR